MPYISSETREDLEPFSTEHAELAGELNYQITRLAWRYANDNGKCYDTFNEIIGVLECAKQEFYRRICGPYETYKQGENGDVYI